MVQVTARGGGSRSHSFLAKHPGGTIYLHNTLCTIFSSSVFITRVSTATSVFKWFQYIKKGRTELWTHVKSRENSHTEHKTEQSSLPEKSLHVCTPTLRHTRYMSTAPLTHSACTLAGPGAGGTQHQASERVGTVPRRKVGHGAAAPEWSSSLPRPTDTYSQVSLFLEHKQAICYTQAQVLNTNILNTIRWWGDSPRIWAVETRAMCGCDEQQQARQCINQRQPLVLAVCVH